MFLSFVQSESDKSAALISPVLTLRSWPIELPKFFNLNSLSATIDC